MKNVYTLSGISKSTSCYPGEDGTLISKDGTNIMKFHLLKKLLIQLIFTILQCFIVFNLHLSIILFYQRWYFDLRRWY